VAGSVLFVSATAQLVDLLLPGWIDHTRSVAVHRPYLFEAILADRDRLDPVESMNHNGGLRTRLVDEINFDNPLRVNSREEVASPVGVHYLSASGSVQRTALPLFTNDESIPNEGIVRAAEMTFHDCFTVFFDPFWTDGRRLGTANAADHWLADDRTARHKQLSGAFWQTRWKAEPAGDSTRHHRNTHPDAVRSRPLPAACRPRDQCGGRFVVFPPGLHHRKLQPFDLPDEERRLG
jgi:hypothetical protein